MNKKQEKPKEKKKPEKKSPGRYIEVNPLNAKHQVMNKPLRGVRK